MRLAVHIFLFFFASGYAIYTRQREYVGGMSFRTSPVAAGRKRAAPNSDMVDTIAADDDRERAARANQRRIIHNAIRSNDSQVDAHAEKIATYERFIAQEPRVEKILMPKIGALRREIDALNTRTLELRFGTVMMVP